VVGMIRSIEKNPIGNRTHDLKELGAKYLENVVASTSYNFMGLHGLLQEYSFTRPFV
jgi:hypothetical protein